MILRTPGDHSVGRLPRPSGLRLLAPCIVLVVALLAFFAGSSGAGVANYQGTLYFAGPASSVGGSFQLTTAVPAAQGATPVAAAGVPNSGGVPSGSYKYTYVTTSGAARTASVASNQVTVTNAPVTVTNVPVGADVYRAKIPSSTNTAAYILLGTNPGPTTTYIDTSSATSGAPLPQGDNRVALSTTGWAPFNPGSSLGSSVANTSVSGSMPAIPSSCAGWIVDASGAMSFAGGLWTFNAQVKPDANGNGAAALTVAMWKVDDSGNTVSGGTVVPPTDGGSFALTGMSQTVTVSYTTSSATTLASNEHLCVQFWRHQTTAYSSGGATSRTIQMLAWDPNNTISVHPAPNGFASATLSSPADGTSTQTTPTLGATYTDSEGDAGTMTIRLCSDSGCGTVLQNSGALAATNGATLTWTPTALADNTYYWQAQAKDGPGLASPWTASRSFVVDTASPSTAITANPPALSNSAGGSFSFNASEAVTGYQCKVDGGAFAGCSSPYAYAGLADGAHTFQVKATADLAGNAGSATSYSWAIDTAPPDTSITSTPAALSNSSSSSFSLSATEPGSSFECNLDGAGFAACPNPKAYSGLGDGPHTFQARAIDSAGNVDPTPDSYSWTIDATPPDTNIGPSEPAALTIATGATFDFSSTEPGSTFHCSRDGASFTMCTSPKTYSGLADGSHTFQVRATDTAGNTDGSPASYTWVVDTTPPDTTIGPTVPPANSPSTSATFDLGSTEAGSTYVCRLDGGSYGSCSSPASYSGLGDGTHTFYAKATDPAGNIDGSAASYSWDVDTVFPATPAASSPADGLLANAMPELDAVFSDATPGGSGTVEFRICSVSAPAGALCAPMVSSVTSGSVANGDTASVTPAPLADGTYHWQTRAQDLAGNQSGWSATRSFQIDSSSPTVPALLSPEDGVWVRATTLQATFSKPAFAGTGTIEFRVCLDGACLGTASSGTSPTLINGATASWSLPERLSDGMYWWQARAHDAAGNASGWSAARMFHLDKTPPPTPKNFNGQVADDGLTLRWESPADDSLANFYVYVNGVSTASLGATTSEYKVGAFDAGDPREFAVVAVDHAGNQSPMSKTLVGVPNVVGLTLGDAESAAKARGLVVRRDSAIQQSGSGVVTSQTPPAGTVAEKGTAVKVVLETGSAPTALTMSASPARLICGAGAVVRLKLRLSESADVQARLLSGRRALTKRNLGHLKPGMTKVTVKLPHHLARGTYRLAFAATAGTRVARTSIVVKTGSRRVCSAH
jgi:PASTA domain/Bacterial Ig-like domain